MLHTIIQSFDNKHIKKKINNKNYETSSSLTNVFNSFIHYYVDIYFFKLAYLQTRADMSGKFMIFLIQQLFIDIILNLVHLIRYFLSCSEMRIIFSSKIEKNVSYLKKKNTIKLYCMFRLFVQLYTV